MLSNSLFMIQYSILMYFSTFLTSISSWTEMFIIISQYKVNEFQIQIISIRKTFTLTNKSNYLLSAAARWINETIYKYIEPNQLYDKNNFRRDQTVFVLYEQ